MNNLLRNTLVLAFIFVFTACENNHSETSINLDRIIENDYLNEVQWKEFQKKGQTNYSLIDTREKSAFDLGHVEEAINVPIAELEAYLRNNSKALENSSVVLYGATFADIHTLYLALKERSKTPMYLLLADYNEKLVFDSLFNTGLDPKALDYAETWNTLKDSVQINAPNPVVVAPQKKKVTPIKKKVKKEEEEGC